MKILLVSDFYPPQVGGMEQHVQALAHQFKLQGHEVFVATTEREDRRDVVAGIEVERLRGSAQRLTFAFSSSSRRYPPPLIDPELTVKLGKCMDRVRPDVLHVHGWTSYSVIAANAQRHLPLVMTLHDYGHFCPKRTLLRHDGTCQEGRGLRCLRCASREYGMLKSVACYLGTAVGIKQLESVDEFIAVSHYVKERSLPYLPKQQIHVIPNFLDPLKFHRQRDEEVGHIMPVGYTLPAKFVLFVGVLAPFKGVDDLIEGFLIAKRRSASLADIQLLLVGREHPSKHYESDQSQGIDVLINPPRGLVVEAIASCQCLVVPSRWHEPCPTVVLEGICAGRTVIGTQVGGIPELLEGVKRARLVPASNPQALAEAIEATIEATAELDTDMASGTSWGGSSEYLPLQPERVAREVVDVYQTAREKRHP